MKNKIITITVSLLLLTSLAKAIRVRDPEYPSYLRAKMATMENATVNEKLELCRKVLIHFGSISRGSRRTPDEIKFRQEVSDFITKTPGHAYEMRRRMLERQAINLGEIEGEYSRREFEYLSKMIGELRSVESIRVLAELLPEMMTYEEKRQAGPAVINIGLYAAANIDSIIENSPVKGEKILDKEAWLQWKKEIEDGTLHFKIKGVDGLYNFDGPIPQKTKRVHSALASQNGGTNISGNKDSQNHTGSLSESLSKSIWFYLIPSFVILAGCWLIYRQKKTS